jgi:hypothetical protein
VKASILVPFVLSIVLAACDEEPFRGSAADHIAGQWAVTTKLVAAQDATNPNYKPGDLRQTQWTITKSGMGYVLTSPDGSVPGQAMGPNAIFESVTDTGRNLRIHVRIECVMASANRMTGTIKANYHGTFGNLVGIDAWTFEATR